MKGLLTSLITVLTFTGLQAQSLPTAPKLVVGLTIDQLRTDYLEAFSSLYGERGFKRLWKEGRVFHNAEYTFSGVDRASAMAAIYSGSTPSVNGIISNRWMDVATLRPVNSTDDAAFMGYYTDQTCAPTKLLTSTIADELKIATQGKGIVYAIAPFCDAAIFAAGHAGNGAFWINPTTGKWSGTTYYGEFPWWASQYNDRQAIDSRISSVTWEPVFPRGMYTFLPDWRDDAYNKLGYVPNNIGTGQNVARTLEYAYNDWTIYTLGKKLGKPASEIDIFKQRALNYKNVYHPERKLMVGKDDKGVFNPKFDAVDWSGEFCEGNSWHWSFCVFHDPQGLIDLMGGKKEFNNMMDSVFVIPGKQGMESRGMIHEMREMQVMNMGQYAHGNQPIQHMVYLYNYSGEPWKAQHWVREIMDKLYTAGPDGYCGDEDNGQTSAWYVFSALGFYPVCPGTDQYILGTPLFKSAKLHLENGKTVTIKASNNNTDNRYVKDMKVNGKAFTRNYLTHDQLLKGANIQYQMSPTPNKQRGTTEKDIPYSLSFE